MRMRPRRSSKQADRGSSTIELILLTPLLLLILMLLLLAGRTTEATIRLDTAAYQAARAASLARSPVQAMHDAQATAVADLTGQAPNCVNPVARVDVAHFTPGGTVTVRLECRTDLTGLAGLRIPASITLSAASTSPVDRFRGVDR